MLTEINLTAIDTSSLELIIAITISTVALIALITNALYLERDGS